MQKNKTMKLKSKRRVNAFTQKFILNYVYCFTNLLFYDIKSDTVIHCELVMATIQYNTSMTLSECECATFFSLVLFLFKIEYSLQCNSHI